MGRWILALTVCYLYLCVSSAGAQSPDLKELEIDHALTFDFQTPHTKWAKPYANGKAKVLFFADGTDTDPRECVELMQRFDIDAQAVFWANVGETDKKYWEGGTVGEQRMLSLLQQKWDCFVFFGLPMTHFPVAQKSLILKAVAQGAGIVFVGSNDTASFLSKKQILPLPAFVADENVSEAYTVGKGRGIRLLGRPKIGYHEGWEIEFDYWQESLGRAVLWSTRKEPAVHLDLVLSPSSKNPAGKNIVQSGSTARLLAKISGKPRGSDLRIKVTARQPGHADVVLPEKGIAPGEEIKISIPKLAAGTWHADARIISSAGVETWYSLPFEVRSERAVSGVTLKPNWGEPGGVISGKVLVSGNRLPRETMRIQLLDRRRRELARKDVQVSGDTIDFSFDIAEWLPMLVTVEARLISGDTEISRSYKYFHVTERKHGQFNFLIWGIPKGTLAPYAEESLAKQGVTLQLDWENPPPYVGAFDVSWVPYTTHFSVEKDHNGIMKPFCWNDRLAARKQISILASGHRASREHGAFVYSLGDENKTLGSCLSPFCAHAYRDFLQESYGTLDALNRSWQTDFRDWKDVGLAKTDDDDELISKNNRNYPRWFDRQAYKSWNYVHYCLKYAKSYKMLDPQAKTGFDGAGGFATGDDLDLIARSLDSWVPYQGPAEEVIRSIAPRNFIRSNWLGGRFKTADPLLQRYWRLVTLGADSVWWWMWSCIGDLHGFLAPDLRPFPEVVEVVKDTRMVRDGLGDLLLHSTMQDDGIAILYSYPSVFAHKLEEGGSFGGYEDAHSALIQHIRAAGLQFRYVTDRMLRQGEVDLAKYRTLFLPRTEAMGDKEAQAIRTFVERGGTVVADFRPGLYDDHCKRRARGVLDELFGIRQNAAGRARTVNLGKSNSLADAAFSLDGAVAGRTIDGIPLMLKHSVGKGLAILLNSQMNNLSRPELAGIHKDSFRGVAPVYAVKGLDGSKAENVEVTRWLNGGIEIVSLLRKDGAKQELAVSFTGTKYVYDLRSRKSHGPCNWFTTTLLPNRASFFVFTNKPAPELRIILDSQAVQPGMTAKADISIPGAEGMHAVKMTVHAGDRQLEWHDRSFLVGSKPLSIRMPVAYNDPLGEYRVEFTDLFTNITYAAKLSVQSVATDGSRLVE